MEYSCGNELATNMPGRGGVGFFLICRVAQEFSVLSVLFIKSFTTIRSKANIFVERPTISIRLELGQDSNLNNAPRTVIIAPRMKSARMCLSFMT